MDCDTYHELIVADIDDTLSPSERETVRAHLDGCAVCRNVRALEAEFAAYLRRGPRLVEAPGAVQERLLAVLARASSEPPLRAGTPRALAVAAALVVLILLVFAALRPAGTDFVRRVSEDYELAATARLPLDVRTSDPRELARYFEGSRRLGFAAVVLDLAPTGYRLLGGAIRERGGTVYAVSVYERDGDIVVCHRFRDAAAPADESEAAIRHYVRAHDLGLWVTRRGGVVCCLSTRMAPQDFERTVLARI